MLGGLAVLIVAIWFGRLGRQSTCIDSLATVRQ
jgi:hypothetical protein